jgi:hypothetical protein
LIAFCTTCKGRVQHIEQTLPKNLADNASFKDAIFIILDYNSPDHLLGYLKSFHRPDLESGRLVVYSYREPGPFHMAHAKNMAHRLGMLEGADILVNLDADNYTGADFAHYITSQFRRENVFLWAKMIKDGAGRLPKGISGRIAVSRHAFLNSGGYDEKYDTWSPDDKDFQTRLRRLGYSAREIRQQYLQAILHNDKMRFKEYRHAQTGMGEDQFNKEIFESDATIANYGKIGTGRVFRNFDFDTPIEIAPLPTRIFGIGMHKTATTSLDGALKILGTDSAHWETAHWAKAIFDEMNTWGRSLTLEKSYALSDLPIPLLYEKLDAAYPGSKFILTIRDEDRWIRSVRNHWSHDHNPFRAAWSTDPFTHKVHKALYGQKGFDEEIFRARYRRHNAEVMEYFKDRPLDLLIMDMEKDTGWQELCPFLNKPIPAEDYPKAFVTRKASV